jgi:hypothetical protein
MLTLVPIGLNLLSSIVIFILSRLKINIGRVWLTASLLSLSNWGVIFGFRWLYPLTLEIPHWLPFGDVLQRSISFQIDNYSWPLLLALCAIQSAVIITDSARLDDIPSPSVWAGVFIVYTVGLLAVLANSVIAFVLVWALVDGIEFIVLIRTSNTNEQINEIVVSTAVKILGLFFLIIGVLISHGQDSPIQINQENNLGLFVLIAVGLRLGVIPFNLPFVSGSTNRRSLGNAIRMISVSTSVILLLRIPIGILDDSLRNVLLTFTVIGIFFGSIMWYGVKSELEGRPYWIITMAGFAIYSALNLNQLALLEWTMALMLGGSVLFLYSTRGRRLTVIPLVAILGIVGLPFTPVAYGWQGVIVSGGFFRNVLLIFSMCLVLLGYLSHATIQTTLLSKKERWIWITYPMGLILLILTQWLVFLLSDLSWYSAGVIYASLVAFLLPLIFFFLFQRYFSNSEYQEFLRGILRPVGKIFTEVLSLRWVYRLLWTILGLIQKIVNAFTNLLEGQGGIIWVIVFLIMFITLITAGDLQ